MPSPISCRRPIGAWSAPSTRGTCPPENRLEWAKGLSVPTVEENPGADILWWVGCAPATDPRAQKTAQALAKVLNAAGVDFAVLGATEQCTGDAARRSGNEYLFYELAQANVEMLNQVAPKRILTTCPHCLHVLKNEYPAFGGNYQVVHHTQLSAGVAGGREDHAGRRRIRAGQDHLPRPMLSGAAERCRGRAAGRR